MQWKKQQIWDKKFHNSLKYIFSPGHVRGLVQRQAKHSEGGEGRIWQTVSREVMEPVIGGSLILSHQLNLSIRPVDPIRDQSKPAWPIRDKPHVSGGVERGWIWPGVGGWQKTLGFPIRSLPSSFCRRWTISILYVSMRHYRSKAASFVLKCWLLPTAVVL